MKHMKNRWPSVLEDVPKALGGRTTRGVECNLWGETSVNGGILMGFHQQKPGHNMGFKQHKHIYIYIKYYIMLLLYDYMICEYLWELSWFRTNTTRTHR